MNASDQERLRAEILDYLARHNVMTLATLGPPQADEGEGFPHAASLFYVNDGFTLYFVSDPKTRHGEHIARNHRVAATIHQEYDDWREIQGIQLHGRAAVLPPGPERTRALELYVAKFSFARPFLSAAGGLGQAILQRVMGVEFYKVTAEGLWYTDNTKGFGHREELVLAEEK